MQYKPGERVVSPNGDVWIVDFYDSCWDIYTLTLEADSQFHNKVSGPQMSRFIPATLPASITTGPKFKVGDIVCHIPDPFCVIEIVVVYPINRMYGFQTVPSLTGAVYTLPWADIDPHYTYHTGASAVVPSLTPISIGQAKAAAQAKKPVVYGLTDTPKTSEGVTCPQCQGPMVKAKATVSGDEYDYCRTCKKEMKEMSKYSMTFAESQKYLDTSVIRFLIGDYK